MSTVPSSLPPQAGGVLVSAPYNTLAVVSLVAGIASYVFVPVVGAVVAVITGHMARSQIRTTREQGGGLALAGLILGYAHLVIVVLVVGLILLVLLGVFGFFAIHPSH
jgi:hypothetical protein